MVEKKRSAPASYPFPFFGAGDASYFEWAEVHVRFARIPTPAELQAIDNRVPPPLRESIDWEGEQLMVASGQFAHVVIADAYPAEPSAKGSAKPVDEEEEDEEFGGRFFFAHSSQVTKFNQDIEQWLLFSHGRCPIVVAFRHEDGESGGTKLSPWHTWSMKQLPRVLPALEPIMNANRDGCAFYMLRGILVMAQEAKRSTELPDRYLDLLHPGRKERAAIKQGNAEQLVQLLSAGPISQETLAAMAEEVERCDNLSHEKELRTLLRAAAILLKQPSSSPLEDTGLPSELWVPLVSAAARALHRDDSTGTDRELAMRVLAEAHKQISAGELGDELANLAFWMAKNGLFSESLEIFEPLISMRGLAKTTYCNALWAIMTDNNKMPVQPARARRFLAACLPLGPENPAIFYNAACIYFELGEIDQVFASLQRAVDHGYEKPDQMQNEPLFEPLRSDPRFGKIFAPKKPAPTKPEKSARKPRATAGKAKKKTN